MVSTNSIIINDNELKTYKNFTNGNEEILDLCLSSPLIFPWCQDFSVLEEYDMGSDHLPIQLIMKRNLKVKYVNNKSHEYNLNKADWEKFKRSLPIEFPLGHENNIEKQNQFLTESLIASADLSIPKKKNTIIGEILPKYIIDLIKVKRTAKNRASKTKKMEDKKI